MTKLFEQVGVLSKRVTKLFERVSVSNERVNKSFEQVGVSSERVTKSFERMQIFFEWFTNGCKWNPAQKRKVIKVRFPVHSHTYSNDFPFLSRIPFTTIKPFKKIYIHSNDFVTCSLETPTHLNDLATHSL